MQSFQTTLKLSDQPLKLSDQPESGTYSLLHVPQCNFPGLLNNFSTQKNVHTLYYTHTHSTDSFASLQLNSPTLLAVYVAREVAVRLLLTASPQVSIMSALILWAALLANVCAWTVSWVMMTVEGADSAVTTPMILCCVYVGETIDPASSLHSFSLSFYLPLELPTSILDRMALVRHTCYKWGVVACLLLPNYWWSKVWWFVPKFWQLQWCSYPNSTTLWLAE